MAVRHPPGMHKIKTAIAGILTLFVASAAVAQTFPTVPGQSVIGRLGTSGVSGPSQAIPIATLAAQIVPTITTQSCGITADGVTDETVKLQNCINRVMTVGGALELTPSANCIKTSSPITINRSTATRYQKQIQIRGFGQGQSCISNTTGTGAILSYSGSLAGLESGLVLESMRLSGGAVTGSTGLLIQKAAFVLLSNVSIEATDYGIDATDTEQFEAHSSQFRFNSHGLRFNAVGTITSANSLNFINSTITNNTVYGLQVTNCNALTVLGGSIQYNGTVGGGTGQFGVKAIDCGNGYGTQLYAGMVFEANGGAGDYVSSQSSGKTNVTFDTVAFARTDFTTVGYGTNQIAISGSTTQSNYKIINSNFSGYGTYVASGARPAIANTNVNAKVEIDGLTTFWSATEAPTTSVLYTGYAGQRTGSLNFAGATSGNLVLTGPATASGTLTLPAATDTLIGKATTDILTNKTFDTAGAGNSFSINGVAATANTGTGSVVRSAAPTFTGNITAATADFSGNIGAGGVRGNATVNALAPAANAGTANALRIFDDGGASNSTSSNSYGIGFNSGTGLFSLTAGTSGSFQMFTSNVSRMAIAANGHVNFTGTAPALTSCGTSPAITGSDVKGTVTMGTGSPTGCIITFATAYGTAPACTVSWRANLASMQYAISTAAITLTQTATSSNIVDYVCSGT